MMARVQWIFCENVGDELFNGCVIFLGFHIPVHLQGEKCLGLKVVWKLGADVLIGL